MRRMVLMVVLLMVMLVGPLRAQAMEEVVSPSNPMLVYMGRFTKDHRCGWTGSAIWIRFVGTSAAAKFEVTQGREAGMQVVVDGKATKRLILTRKQTRYALASGLKAGEHTIELFKSSEGYLGEVKFEGFVLSPGAQVKPLAALQRKILVVGDSITCGYGNEANGKRGNNVRVEDGYMSYAAIVARRVQAQAMMICWSGRGMYRNLRAKNDKEGTLPKLFDRTLPLRDDIDWDPKQYVPNVIVINLGTNDVPQRRGNKPALKREDFVGTYVKFIKRLHGLYPKAQVLATIGPMRNEPISGWLKGMAKRFDYVHALVFPRDQRTPADTAMPGPGGHPSVQGDKKMADQLVPMIRRVAGW